MKIYYITLNTIDKAKAISFALLEKKLIACANWFPISSAYRWEGEIKQEKEVVLIVKTRDGLRGDLEKVVSEHISYTNFIAEIDVASVNRDYFNWLNREVPEGI